MQEFNPYAAPLADLSYSRDPNEVGVWRDGSLLVMNKEAELPDRCLKCNEPANGWKLKKSLIWHNPMLYILLISPLIYVIVAVIVQKKAKLRVPLCQAHRRSRRNLNLWALGLCFLGPLLIVGVLVVAQEFLQRLLSSHQNLFLSWGLVLLAVVMFPAGLIVAVIASQVVLPERIDNRYVWLKKVSPDLLAELPIWSNVLPVTGPNRDNNGMISFPKKARTGTARNDLVFDDEL